MGNTRVFSLVATIVVFSTLAQAQLPDWARTGKALKYPDDWYWVSVASAMGSDGLEKAKEQARVGIASQLRVTVSSKVKYVQSEKIIGDVSNYSTDMASETQSVVDKMPLTNLEFAESYVNPVDTRTYVLAVLEKQLFLDGLLRDIKTPVRELEAKLENARGLVASADVGEAVNSYSLIMAAVPDLYPKIFFFNSLSPKPYELPTGLVYDNIEFELTKILSGVSLKTRGGDKQTVALGRAFPAPLEVVATIETGGKTLPLKGLYVAFRTGKDDEEKILTDGNGLASCTPIVSPDLLKDETHGQLSALIEIPHTSMRLRHKVERNTSVTYSFTASVKQFTVRVDIAGDGSDAAQFELVKRVTKALEKNNVRVNQGSAKFLLHLVVTSNEGPSVSGMAATLHVQNVDVTGMLKDASSGTVVGTLSASSKGVDKDRGKALVKGIQDAEFDAKDLAAILARARDL